MKAIIRFKKVRLLLYDNEQLLKVNQFAKLEDKIRGQMAFFEVQLVILALIFIFALGFFILGRRNNTLTATEKQRRKRKSRQRATRQRRCQYHPHRTPRRPGENDDDEPYNPYGKIFW